jgi:hypothetical protein
MIELFEDYILDNWQSIHLPLPVPQKLSYLFVKGFRKAIFFVFKDGESQPFAVLKATKDPIAFARLSREYKTLSYISRIKATEGVIPRPLAFFELRGHTCVLESALGGTPMIYVMKGIRTKGGLLRMKGIFRMVVDTLIQLVHADRAKTGRTQKRAAIVEHGDLNPANLSVTRAGIKIFDWEYSNIHGTALHDLLDFALTYVLFARYLTNEIRREHPIFEDFEATFFSQSSHAEIIWENVMMYSDKIGLTKSSMQNIFASLGMKYLDEKYAQIFSRKVNVLL